MRQYEVVFDTTEAGEATLDQQMERAVENLLGGDFPAGYTVTLRVLDFDSSEWSTLHQWESETDSEALDVLARVVADGASAEHIVQAVHTALAATGRGF